MLDNRVSLPGARRRVSFFVVVTLVAVMVFASAGQVLAADRTHSLQGLFCNTDEQIDETLAHMRQALAPRAAVELTNDDAVVCTFVDLLHYLVDHPVIIKEIRGFVPLFKYEGTLIGVVVGGAVRPVTPPVQIFFVMPEKLPDAPQEGRA